MFWCWVKHLSYNSSIFFEASLLIIFLSFLHNVLNMAWTTTSFNCKPPSMCVHTSHRPYKYPPFTLHPWQWTHENPWYNFWHYCCHCARFWLVHGTKTITHVSFSHTQLLLLTNWHCVDQRWNLHLSWYYIVIVDPMLVDLFPWSCITQRFVASNVTQTKENLELLYSTPHWSILPFSNLDIWISKQPCWCVLTWLCQCHLELQKGQKALLFLSWLFLFIQKFNYIAKDANILLFKLGDSGRLSYFPTSTPLGHNPPHRDQPITSGRLLRWRFWHLVCANLMSFKFSLLFLIPLYIFGVSSVFINKALQGSDELLV